MIRNNFFQCQNFVRLCELLVRSCPNLRLIDLLTSKDNKTERDQRDGFNNLADDLKKYNVNLRIEYSDTLHDRQIT